MLDLSYSEAIQHRIDNKTKPLGALGQLEKLAHQLALIQSQGKKAATSEIVLANPTLLVFAGDHGIATQGVSIAPSEVTTQMVQNFLSGGAAINSFCNVADLTLKVVDCGILTDLSADHPELISQRLGKVTADFSQQAAMSLESVEKGISLGRQVVRKQIDSGSNVLMFGEMGIGNTSSAAALMALLTSVNVDDCVGKGTGINEEQLSLKTSLIGKAVKRANAVNHDETSAELSPTLALAEVGGFEIVQMVGAFIEAREANVPVLVDGFIVTVAAYVAHLIKPEIQEGLIFAHCSQENAHQHLLSLMQAEPLLDLGLRLGEGTGAALAYPLLQASAEFYNRMASFDDAGVTV